jgi:hypothetical integral membrane protein (TIGR02206 family)
VRLSGAVHSLLLAFIALTAVALPLLCRRGALPARATRLAMGYGIALNELIWWVFRYSHEGIHSGNLPLQLCDATVWGSVAACLTLAPAAVEFTYFAGLAGAGMALLTPDLWSPWPSYPAIYFFVAHGGIVAAVSLLVFGGIAPLRRGAEWRAFASLLGFAAAVGAFNAAFGTNYMYLRRKPAAASLLDAFGPWPWYWIAGAALAAVLFWALTLPLKVLGERGVGIIKSLRNDC